MTLYLARKVWELYLKQQDTKQFPHQDNHLLEQTSTIEGDILCRYMGLEMGESWMLYSWSFQERSGLMEEKHFASSFH